MSSPTPLIDALRGVELAAMCLRHPPMDRAADLLRHDFQSAILALRDLITPQGDPLFVQVSQNKRALQMVVLAGEHLWLRGWRIGGPEDALLEAALVAAKDIEGELRA